MNSLDQIPWKDLTHAYGSAADVPELLRALRTASPELDGEESPLWQLFGNIWHQGTVYEATAYAVPFLVDLAVDRQTPDRVGILSLLAEIAKGNSYRDVHGNLLKDRDFEQKRNQELLWAQQSNKAVAKGTAQFVEMTNESGDVACAAAFVLTSSQFRAVRALYNMMKGGKRIFHGHFPYWGLPDTVREWRELASGHEPSPVDERLPLLADARTPQQSIAPRELEVGQKVIHRHFGQGTVTKLDVGPHFTIMTICFDEEGAKDLSLPTTISDS